MTETISRDAGLNREVGAGPPPAVTPPAAIPAAAAPAPGVPALADPTGGRRASGGRRRVPPWTRRLAGPILIYLVWQVASSSGLASSRDLPSPAAVVSAGREMASSGDLGSALAVSLYRVGMGLAFGVAIGLALAVLAGLFRLGEDVIDSAMNFLRTVPVIALLPMIIIWIGIGEPAKIFLIAAGVVFPVYMNTFAGIRGVDARLVEAARTFGLRGFGLVRRVIIPGALPGFLVGLRWALGVAWLLLVFAEQINADKGLGYLLNQGQSWNRTDVILLCVVIYGALGLLGDGLVRLLERSLLSWRRGFTGT
ncbi:MAG: ABC transporter permease [Frankia sp.]